MIFVDSKYRIHKGFNSTGQLEKLARCVSCEAGLKLCRRSNRYFGLLFVKLAVLRLFSGIQMSSGENKICGSYCLANIYPVCLSSLGFRINVCVFFELREICGTIPGDSDGVH